MRKQTHTQQCDQAENLLLPQKKVNFFIESADVLVLVQYACRTELQTFSLLTAKKNSDEQRKKVVHVKQFFFLSGLYIVIDTALISFSLFLGKCCILFFTRKYSLIARVSCVHVVFFGLKLLPVTFFVASMLFANFTGSLQ